MSSAMEIPLIFCHITKYISDMDAIKLSRINKYFYDSLAKYVNLTVCITMEQLKKNKKFQIRAVQISSSDELRELLTHPSCTKIQELVFEDSMNDSIEHYPQNIKKITFGWNYQLTDNLPTSVAHVTFGDSYNQLTDKLPASVTHVTFGYWYNQPTNNLPPSVTHITFNSDYNQLTDKLPTSVTHVTFGWRYDQPTNHLPASVTHVVFGSCYDKQTDNLPASVTHVTFGLNYNQPTDKLPASVTHVTFGWYYNQSLDKLPAVKEVEVCEHWEHNVNTIPEHVKTIRRKKWCNNTNEYKYEKLR
jgi:hypothetical protein